MTQLELPSREALEQAEAFIARSRRGIPNPDNVDVWMRAPASWDVHIFLARYIEQQQNDLRDRFAGQALATIEPLKFPASNGREQGEVAKLIELEAKLRAAMAYHIADAMLAARMEGRP